jgi:hypothetical protein
MDVKYTTINGKNSQFNHMFNAIVVNALFTQNSCMFHYCSFDDVPGPISSFSFFFLASS